MSDDAEIDARLMSAMTTEHFVMQTMISTTIGEAGSRATIFIMALSSSLVALGFASDSDTAFVPFAATVLPGVFVLGIFTVLRMTDIAMENLQAHMAIARIRKFYRGLGPEAAQHFAVEFGRWPEGMSDPSMRIGPFAGYLTTASMMIAVMNAMIAGVGTALLLLGLGLATAWSVLCAAAVALALIALFYRYQRWRSEELAKEISASA